MRSSESTRALRCTSPPRCEQVALDGLRQQRGKIGSRQPEVRRVGSGAETVAQYVREDLCRGLCRRRVQAQRAAAVARTARRSAPTARKLRSQASTGRSAPMRHPSRSSLRSQAIRSIRSVNEIPPRGGERARQVPRRGPPPSAKAEAVRIPQRERLALDHAVELRCRVRSTVRPSRGRHPAADAGRCPGDGACRPKSRAPHATRATAEVGAGFEEDHARAGASEFGCRRAAGPARRRRPRPFGPVQRAIHVRQAIQSLRSGVSAIL
jgi:hypothetical protein